MSCCKLILLLLLLSGCTIRVELLPEDKPEVTRQEIKAALTVRDQAIRGLAKRIEESHGKEEKEG